MSEKTKQLLVAVPVVLLLLAIAIPNFVGSREVVSMNACANNLRQIQAAKERWARDNKEPTDAIPTRQELLPIIWPTNQQQGFPTCPSQGAYSIGRVDEPVKCSKGGIGHTLPTD